MTEPCTVHMLTVQHRAAVFASGNERAMTAIAENGDVHSWATEQFTREWNDMPPMPMGGQQGTWEREQESRLAKVFRSVVSSAVQRWGISASRTKAMMAGSDSIERWKFWGLVGFGLLSFLVFGFTGVVLLIIGAVFGFMIQVWCQEITKITQARTSLGLA